MLQRPVSWITVSWGSAQGDLLQFLLQTKGLKKCSGMVHQLTGTGRTGGMQSLHNCTRLLVQKMAPALHFYGLIILQNCKS
jgi:hypothetical protein